MKFDLEERTDMKTDPEKAAVDMRMGRNPDTSRMFERKDWPTRTQVQGFLGRRTFTERRRSNKDLRCWKTWPATLVFNIPICHDSHCLCDLSYDRKLFNSQFSDGERNAHYFAIPHASRDRKTTLVTKLSSFLERGDCHR